LDVYAVKMRWGELFFN